MKMLKKLRKPKTHKITEPMTVEFLGCGASVGVPALVFGYGLADPKNPKNNRTRTSALVRIGDITILIDSGPDIRQQLLRAGVTKIDAVLYTHSHYDHMAGANDLHPLFSKNNDTDYTQVTGNLPIFGSAKHLNDFKQLLKHFFKQTEKHNIFKLHKIRAGKPFHVQGIKIVPIYQRHGKGFSMGYRIGDFAYSTDVKSMKRTGFKALAGVKTWVLDVTSPRLNDRHLTPKEAIEWGNRIKPDRIYFTHMGIRLDYDTMCQRLPKHVRPAYDGLKITI